MKGKLKEIRGYGAAAGNDAVTTRFLPSVDPKCPKCHGALFLRHGRFGDFYGCSGWPKCSFTVKAAIVDEAIQRRMDQWKATLETKEK